INYLQLAVAKYLYDPFGNSISALGPWADLNLYRFSSKELHSGSSLYYYRERFFDPSLHRWLNRDPISELGGLNLYGFGGNNPVNEIDPFGLINEPGYFGWPSKAASSVNWN